VADVADSKSVRAMFDSLSRIDILVNCAGIAESAEGWAEVNRTADARLAELERTGTIETHWDVTMQLDDDSWRRMLAVHLDGTFFCTREALRKMSPENRGVIVNVSSTAALTGLPDAPHYSAAKAGILGFTRAVARDVASRGIRVNAVAPGFTETPMTASISRRSRRKSLSSIPLGRWAEPGEIAAVVLFLASDDSSYITGQCLSPNGGSVSS
jgi:3-oxoacyl-[acyl-carrier protein] reductase